MRPHRSLPLAVALVLLLTVSLSLSALVDATPTSAPTARHIQHQTQRQSHRGKDGISSAAQIVTSPLGPPPDAEVLVGPGNRSILARAAAFGPRLPVPPRLLPPSDDDDDPDTPSDEDDDSLPPDTQPRRPRPSDPPAVQLVAGRLVPLTLADPGNHHGCVPVPPSIVAHWPTGPKAPPVPVDVPSSSPSPRDNSQSRNTDTSDKSHSQPPVVLLPPRPPFVFTSSSDSTDNTFDSSSTLSLDTFFSADDDTDSWPPIDPPTLVPPLPVGGPWIALVQRGGCAFVDKVRAMQRSGASAVIVGDDDAGAGAMLVTMYAGGDVSDVRVSSVFVSFADYSGLIAQAQTTGEVDVWLVGNGAENEEWTVVDMILAAVVAPLILLVGVYALCRACIRSAGAPAGADGRNGGPPEPATSARILASLPTKVFYLAKAREEDCLTCVICLDEFEDDVELVELPCKHTFHGECIQTWLRDRKNVCPICRFELVERDEEEGGDDEVDVGTSTPGAVDIPGPGFAAAANHGVPPHVISLSLPNAPPRAASAPPASSTVINMPPSPVGRGRRRVRVPSRLAATAAAAAAATSAAAAAATAAAVGVARSRSADQDEAAMLVQDRLETSLGQASEEYLVQRVASTERTDDDDEDETPLSSSPLTEVDEVQEQARPRFVRITVPDVDGQHEEDSEHEDEHAPLLSR